MNLTLSWDLFAVVFFALVVTYTFIIGRRESVKMMIACYIGVIVVQGLGNALQRALGMGTGDLLLSYTGFSLTPAIFTITKLALFVAIVVYLTLKAGFDVLYTKESNIWLTMLMTALFGIATAGFLLSTLVTYIAGVPLLDSTLQYSPSLAPILDQSMVMKIMIQNQDLWFAFPGLLLGVAGFLHHNATED